MRIGFDFDNTIVNYDRLFHKVALEQGVIDHSIPVNKLAVRDHLRAMDQEHIWTEMQGYVYGARMVEADAYPDVLRVMQRLKADGHSLVIVSHKTKHPYLGKQYDLHAAARAWIDNHLVVAGKRLLADDQIYFRITKEEKLQCIADLGCDVFIDDLPEILMSALFPANAKRFLFDPEQHHAASLFPELSVVSSWIEFENAIVCEKV
jgi:FMN phosphatase YigB (HAD superfamily)